MNSLFRKKTFVQLLLTVDNMKRLGFRSAFVSTVEKVGLKNKCSQNTEPQLFYIVCCKLVFILQSQSVTSFYKSNILSLSICTDLATEHEPERRGARHSQLILFFVGGGILKPPLKAVIGLAFVSSLVSFGLSVARATYQCAYK